ncbi:MAG: hypothetical protein J7M25_17745 [Deltaproteobacteria bacterium]|nr:hypothetical protein [Deltaproteobacteria bacterium]
MDGLLHKTLPLFGTLLLVGCGSVRGSRASVLTDARAYHRGQDVRVVVKLAKGSVGMFLQMQRRIGSRWQKVATFNPRKQCPVMQTRAEGGYRFITKTSAMCRLLQGTWSVLWTQMMQRQCVKPTPVESGTYRICAVQFTKRCLAREGPYGFELPRAGSRRLSCSAPFVVR